MMFRWGILAILGSFFVLGVTGCQSDPAMDFKHLKPGMEKNDVLEVMGSPQRTQRWHGMDRWTYIYYEQKQNREEKEVHFDQGKAVYIGEKYSPPVTAKEQDDIFDEQNQQLEKQYAARREEARTNLSRYHEEAEGENEVRYVPQYEPVK